MRRTVLLLILYVLAKTAVADSILVLGDSLSAAFGFELDHGWVHLLQAKLASQDSDDNPWRVINASVAGETTAGGLARLPQLLDAHQPTIVILALGANDGLRGQSIQRMQLHLTAMIEQSQQVGEVILLGMRLPPNYGKAYTQAFENSYAEIAQQYGVHYVPFFIRGVTESEKTMQEDNFHPNALAQPQILANIWPTVTQVISLAN